MNGVNRFTGMSLGFITKGLNPIKRVYIYIYIYIYIYTCVCVCVCVCVCATSYQKFAT